ncbi:MAG TPA: carboxypeptidase-like regulatory domain-containing protein [Balneolaceae bacterium]|nr:carboxypeptidase-like regulatory domain-containing protein [Balneolaceae bacterium]
MTDQNNNDPVPSVNVYISGTMAGTTTDGDGSFEFTTDHQGKFELVFSYIGYKTVTKPVLLNSDTKQLQVIVHLEENTIEFEELVVESDNKSWQSNYEVFVSQFIGTSANADETFIQNSWVLDFRFDEDGSLVAVSDEPILIANHALGYEMHVDLIAFKWGEAIDLALFKMKMKFTEMETDNKNKKEKWEETREKTYKGSFEHFLYSMYEDDLDGNSFEIKPENGIVPLSAGETRLRLMESGQTYSGRLRLLKGYMISDITEILYGQKKKSLRDNRRRSLIAPMVTDGNGYFFITENRSLLDPVSLRVGGEWGFQRVADMVPKEFYMD